jgi:PKHD-type hydroxylase
MTHSNQSAWPFEVDHVEAWSYWDNLFTKEECEMIVAIGQSKKPEAAGVIGGEELKAVRDSNIAWIFPAPEVNWIFQRVAGAVHSLNNDFFKFDLFGLTEGFQFTEYAAPTGYYGAHIDCGKGIPPRKLSVTIQLSPSDAYEGGDLLLHYDKTPTKAPTEQGKAIVFPSYLLHEVTPVTKGTRHSLVCWVTGRPFK